jgi:hypothetical protein
LFIVSLHVYLYLSWIIFNINLSFDSFLFLFLRLPLFPGKKESVLLWKTNPFFQQFCFFFSFIVFIFLNNLILFIALSINLKTHYLKLLFGYQHSKRHLPKGHKKAWHAIEQSFLCWCWHEYDNDASIFQAQTI